MDRSLAPLLMSLWSKGYSTFASCQGGPSRRGSHGDGYILFNHDYPTAELLTVLPWPSQFLTFAPRSFDERVSVRFPGLVEA